MVFSVVLSVFSYYLSLVKIKYQSIVYKWLLIQDTPLITCLELA